jgi:hypothetical protein
VRARCPPSVVRFRATTASVRRLRALLTISHARHRRAAAVETAMLAFARRLTRLVAPQATRARTVRNVVPAYVAAAPASWARPIAFKAATPALTRARAARVSVKSPRVPASVLARRHPRVPRTAAMVWTVPSATRATAAAADFVHLTDPLASTSANPPVVAASTVISAARTATAAARRELGYPATATLRAKSSPVKHSAFAVTLGVATRRVTCATSRITPAVFPRRAMIAVPRSVTRVFAKLTSSAYRAATALVIPAANRVRRARPPMTAALLRRAFPTIRVRCVATAPVMVARISVSPLVARVQSTETAVQARRAFSRLGLRRVFVAPTPFNPTAGSPSMQVPPVQNTGRLARVPPNAAIPFRAGTENVCTKWWSTSGTRAIRVNAEVVVGSKWQRAAGSCPKSPRQSDRGNS